MKRRYLFSVFCGFAAAASAAHAADTAQYPTKPIRLIVPFAPGGSADVPARMLANAFTTSMGQQVVVDNRAGASGILAGDLAAKALPDGHTILLGSIGMLTIIPNLKKSLMLGFDTLAALAHVKSGRLKALAVSTATRSPLLPDVPTVAEAGVPGYETSSWNGIVVPAGTPKSIVLRLNSEIARALANPDLRDRMQANGNTPKPTTPEEFRRLIRQERARWGKLIRDANITVE